MNALTDDPGVQGLVQLGRNAIERVTQLESEIAALRAANRDLRDWFDAALAEISELNARMP